MENNGFEDEKKKLSESYDNGKNNKVGSVNNSRQEEDEKEKENKQHQLVTGIPIEMNATDNNGNEEEDVGNGDSLEENTNIDHR
jgi:hypothetical protein